MEIVFNRNNINNRRKFYNDVYLNRLVDLSIANYNISGLNIFIRYMFYSYNALDYEEMLSSFNLMYNESISCLFEVYGLFLQWNAYEKYNLGEVRGAFLELLTFKLLKNIHDNSNIHRESYVKLDDYRSHSWDIIVEIDDILELYECKFSFESLKRGQLNQIFGSINNLNANVFLIFYQLKRKLTDNIEIWRENTSKDKFDYLINSVNIITLEDFSDGNPFLK